MKHLLFILCMLSQFTIIAQTTISGKVTDGKNTPILGANVYLDGTYDGSSTDNEGNFSFTTSETGTQTIIVSFISFEEFILNIDVSKMKNMSIKLREDVNSLDAVVISTGTFEAGDNAKVTALKPLDIVTTASALGDFVGALQTLPGTATVAEDGRLFVRGGEAEETQIFIDGIRVFTPFTPSANNIPVRGRYSPMLFKGVSFSTGGYSAEYGQALSSVLALNTIDQPIQEETNVQLMTVGVGVGNTQIFGKSSLSVNASYINLAPYQEILPDRNNWIKTPEVSSGEMVYRYQFKDESLLKIYGAFSYTNFDLIQEDINFEDGLRFGLENRNLYFNTSYKKKFGVNWRLETGLSFTNDTNNFNIDNSLIDNNDNSLHAKVKLKKQISNRFKISFGSEYFLTDFNEEFSTQSNNFDYGFNSNLAASFVETDFYFSKNIATKVGLRAEYSELLDEFTLSPRATIAYKFAKKAQFSLAYGQFYQNPKNDFLKFIQNVKAENTSHFIANFQSVTKDQILNVEVYYKDYNSLIRYNTLQPNFASDFNNNGFGYARGIDVFWRQNQKVKNTDYWISYSYLDTKRNYRNYPNTATPNFAPKHNLSVVAKHWIEDWKSQVGFAYTFASGRNYTNPNTTDFLGEQTKNFNSLSLNWAYLIDQQKILYFSVNNALGTKNIFGYNYANTRNNNGVFEREAILPNVNSFFFVGFFWTISDNKKTNQLNNL